MARRLIYNPISNQFDFVDDSGSSTPFDANLLLSMIANDLDPELGFELLFDERGNVLTNYVVEA